MPTYEYRCDDCGEVIEQTESISEHGTAMPKCPKCASEKVRQTVSATYVQTSKKS